eukprot:symbB.v1.2.031521.t1/scaffold3668.1/size52292/1
MFLIGTSDGYVNLQYHWAIERLNSNPAWEAARASLEGSSYQVPEEIYSPVPSTQAQLDSVTSSSLRLPEKALFPGAQYRFVFNVSDINNPSRFSIAATEIKVTQSQPHLGSLRVSPTRGVSGITEFTLEAYGWSAEEDGMPLLYDFGYLDAQGAAINGMGSKPFPTFSRWRVMTCETVPQEGPVLLGRAQIENEDMDVEKNEAKEIALQKGGRARLPVVAWFQMLYRAFGLFVPLALLSYGIQQSFGKTYQIFACKYYMMNDLELDGVTMGRLMAAASVPWNIKPLLGMLSDTFPLGGYHRTSYLVLACSLSILLHSWIGLSAVSSLGLVAFMTCVNFTTPFSDVLVDATSAILAKDHPSEACDLQVALRISEAVGGIMAGAVKGSVVAHFGARNAILSNGLSALTVLFPALRGWLPEERLKEKRCSPKWKAFNGNTHLTLAACFLAMIACHSPFYIANFPTRWEASSNSAANMYFCDLVLLIPCFQQVLSIFVENFFAIVSPIFVFTTLG